MKKVLLASIVMAGLLSGCQTDVAQDQKIAALEAQVAQLASIESPVGEMSAVKMTAMNAQAEAERANKRIDNIATSYQK